MPERRSAPRQGEVTGCDHQQVKRLPTPVKEGSWFCPKCSEHFKSDPFDRFFTLPEQAQLMVGLAVECGLRAGQRVLEPSAGAGALVHALPNDVAVTAVELVGSEADKLDGVHPALQVFVADFLRWTPPVVPGRALVPFDLALMNPPYSSVDGADGLHVARALRWSRSAIALVRTNFLHGFGRYHAVFRWFEVTHQIILSRRPSFDGPADNGLGARHDYQILRFAWRQGGERKPGEQDRPYLRFVV